MNSNGRSTRNKGLRVEREIVDRHKSLNIKAERVPLSGAAGGSFKGDVCIGDRPFRAEVKARKTGDGFKKLEQWLGDNDMLFLKRNNKLPMVTLSWDTYMILISQSEKWDNGMVYYVEPKSEDEGEG